MSNWKDTAAESQRRWEANADAWDERMGERSNQFHREIIRPDTERLLDIKPGERVLDIACGNGNFSRRLVELGATVTAFDYSPRLVEHARKRCAHCLDKISFHVIDATSHEDLAKLTPHAPFDKAVANMALMDIADIVPLLGAVHSMLISGGVFVFSTVHPCFQTRGMRKIVESEDIGGKIHTRYGIQTFEYIKPGTHEVMGIDSEILPIIHYHRPLSVLLEACFDAGFVVSGLAEPVFKTDNRPGRFDWYEMPPAIIVRLARPQN